MLGLAGAVLGLAERGKRKDAEEALATERDNRSISQQRYDLLQSGLKQGEAKATQLTGMTADQLGTDIQDIYRRRRERMDQPSMAAEEIRRRGQTDARRARTAGASDAQQRQINMDTGRAAGLQADMDYEQRVQSTQDLLGSFLKTQSALAPGYAQLNLASQYIPTAERDTGLIGKVLGGIGLV